MYINVYLLLPLNLFQVRSPSAVYTMEEGKDGVESVAQMCDFISELYCLQRGGGGRERLWEMKNWEVNDGVFRQNRTDNLWITDPALYHSTTSVETKKISNL